MRRKTTFSELYADVEQLEKKLNQPEVFYQQRQASYHGTAAAIARRVLLSHRPPETPPDQWRPKVEKIIARVTAHLMLGDGLGGMVLSVSAASSDDGKLDPDKSKRGLSQAMTHADVVEWIKAGENGVPGGKIWKQVDYKRFSDAGGGDKGYSAIATVVMRAYYSRNPVAAYSRLRRAIQRYVNGENESSGEPLLDAIATAWKEHFDLRLRRDLRAHVAQVIREF